MSYSLEIKSNVLEKYKNGMNIYQISKNFNIPRSTIYHWVDTLIERPIDELIISKKEIMINRHNLDKVRKENQILQYVLTNINIPKSRKIEFVHLLKKRQYEVKTICRILDIDSSSYYHNKNRKPKKTLIEIDDDKFKPLIKNIFEKSDGRFGSKKIRISLTRDGHNISATRISRLMKEMNLKVNRPDEEYNNYHKRNYSYKPNIISKSELYPEPNKIWVSDITYIKVQKTHYYLYAIIDLFSRRIIGYKLTKTLEAVHMVELMDETYHIRKKPKELIFHSDQGLQYTANKFKDYLKANGITQSFSKKGCPYDNSVAESFFASFKKEEIYRHIYEDFNHLEKSIDEYIRFYNIARYHASLKYMTPIEFEKNHKA